MSLSRRCPECQTWNEDQARCQSCNTALDPGLIRSLKEEKRAQELAKKKKPFLDHIADEMKYSRWFVIRGLYWTLYSVWFVLFSILSFFLAMIAAGPG